jgi:hypothetical protein
LVRTGTVFENTGMVSARHDDFDDEGRWQGMAQYGQRREMPVIRHMASCQRNFRDCGAIRFSGKFCMAIPEKWYPDFFQTGFSCSGELLSKIEDFIYDRATGARRLIGARPVEQDPVRDPL